MNAPLVNDKKTNATTKHWGEICSVTPNPMYNGAKADNNTLERLETSPTITQILWERKLGPFPAPEQTTH